MNIVARGLAVLQYLVSLSQRTAWDWRRCGTCGKTCSEQPALLIRGSWYAREVHCRAVDHWQHVGTSLRQQRERPRTIPGIGPESVLPILARLHRWDAHGCRRAPANCVCSGGGF